MMSPFIAISLTYLQLIFSQTTLLRLASKMGSITYSNPEWTVRILASTTLSQRIPIAERSQSFS